MLLEAQVTDPMFVFDADAHYYEARDAFTRYLAEEYRGRSVTFRTGPKNENYVFIGDQPLRTLPEFYPGLQAGKGLDDFFDALTTNEIDNRPASEAQPEWFASAPRAQFSRWRQRHVLARPLAPTAERDAAHVRGAGPGARPATARSRCLGYARHPRRYPRRGCGRRPGRRLGPCR